MAILSTLLHVLLIIGKVLLVIVLIILALIALLLLAPFCYNAQVKADQEHFQADGGVSWLLFVARVRFHLRDQEKQFEVYLLGIPVMRLLQALKNRKKKDKLVKTAKSQEPETSGTEEMPSDQDAEGSERKESMSVQPENAGGQNECGSGQQKEVSAQEIRTDLPDAVQNREDVSDRREKAVKQKKESARRQKEEARKQRAALREQKKAARAEKLEARKNAHRQKKSGSTAEKQSITEKIRPILSKVRWGMQLIQTEMFKEALYVTKTCGFRVMKHVMPRKVRGYIRFGLDDPARTGQICGILAMLYPRMPEKLEVIPDFQEACFEADVDIRGHVCLIYFLIQGIKIILNRNVRLLIKVVRQKVPLEKVIAAENRRRSGGTKNGK